MDPTLLGRAAVTFAFLVCSLGFVTWRQSRALEVYQQLDEAPGLGGSGRARGDGARDPGAP